MTAQPLSQRLLQSYYAGTFLFIALDFAVGLNLRITFLDGLPAWRITYYLVCLACAALMWRFPAWTSVIAAGESCINLAGLIIEMWLRIFAMPDMVLDGGDPITLREIVNFMLSGSIAWVGLALHRRQLRADLGSGRFGF